MSRGVWLLPSFLLLCVSNSPRSAIPLFWGRSQSPPETATDNSTTSPVVSSELCEGATCHSPLRCTNGRAGASAEGPVLAVWLQNRPCLTGEVLSLGPGWGAWSFPKGFRPEKVMAHFVQCDTLLTRGQQKTNLASPWRGGRDRTGSSQMAFRKPGHCSGFATPFHSLDQSQGGGMYGFWHSALLTFSLSIRVRLSLHRLLGAQGSALGPLNHVLGF